MQICDQFINTSAQRILFMPERNKYVNKHEGGEPEVEDQALAAYG